MNGMNANFTRLFRAAFSAYRQAKKQQVRTAGRNPRGKAPGGGRPTATRTTAEPAGPPSSTPSAGSTSAQTYPGDYTGPVDAVYDPHPDGRADPGEIVWTWVPYQEDHSRGKDRPVLIVGRNGAYLLALMLTSKDHANADAHDDAYVDIGTGDWDSRRRPSEVRVDRVVQVRERDVRREGAVLERDRFNAVLARLDRR